MKRNNQHAANLQISDLLARHGDTQTQVRAIDHWAYFPTAESRSLFVAKCLTLGLRIRSLHDDGRTGAEFCARLFHIDIPNCQVMDDLTLSLHDLAANSGGEYDGWETQVVK
jgi:hypothetical protein